MSQRRKKNVRASRLGIDQRTFVKARGETDNTVVQRILVQLKKFDFYNRRDLIREIAEHPRLPQQFRPIYTKNRVFHGAQNIRTSLSRENYPFWLLGIFIRHQGLLKAFLGLKAQVTSQVLKGDAVSALQRLAAVSELSECWWCIESAIHINKELLKNDTKGYIKQLQETYANLDISIITRDLLLLSESSTTIFYVETVLGRIKEYKAAAIDHAIQYGAVESCLLLPRYYDPGREPRLESLHDYSTWSILDQYMLFRSILMENPRPEGFPDEWLAEVKQLAASIDDWELSNSLTPDLDSDAFIKDVLDKYTLGDYGSVMTMVASAIDEGSPKSFGLLEIYARSKIYSSKIACGKTFFDELADELAKILILDPKSSERIGYLHKIVIKFRREAWAKSLLYHLVALQEWRTDADSVEVARRQTLCLGAYNTPKAKRRHFALDNISTEQLASIPHHRRLRYADEAGTEGIEANVFPIYSDYLKTKSRSLVETGAIWHALNFCIEEYLKNAVAFDYLPVRQLCGLGEGLARDGDFDYIACLIVTDIYARECDSSFEERKSDLFEEFLRAKGTYQPSKIFSPASVDSKAAYFLRNICVPAQLDNIIEFASYDEVIHERVAIIDLLISARAGNVEELRSEKDKAVETLFSEKLRAKIEAGKLYVDVQAIEAQRKHIYIGLYDQAKSIEGGITLEPLAHDLHVDTHDVLHINNQSPVAVASSEKSNLLAKIFMQAIHDFALSENYGLDKYLSAEVRHVVFVTQLRSCFEKNGLVTVQKGGEYLSNSLWTQKYDYVPSGIVDEIDRALGKFSQEVDSILARVNDRFRVKVVDPSLDHIFDFCPYHSRLVRISEIVDQSRSFDQFFKGIFGFMWELAIENARYAQQLINDVLLPDILAAIDRLEAEINDVKSNIAMVDLMQAIRNSRSDFKKEIELVLNWFRFVGSEDSHSFERLGVVIEAAVASFQSMFRHKRKDLIFTQERSDLLLNYSEARSLFISLFTALENALRYGRPDTPVIISHQNEGRSDRLTISNEIGAEIKDPSSFVSARKAEWTNEYLRLSTAEGGSGLYKIHNLLTNASMGFAFDIAIETGRFNAFMDLDHEYSDNRRQPVKA